MMYQSHETHPLIYFTFINCCHYLYQGFTVWFFPWKRKKEETVFALQKLKYECRILATWLNVPVGLRHSAGILNALSNGELHQLLINALFLKVLHVFRFCLLFTFSAPWVSEARMTSLLQLEIDWHSATRGDKVIWAWLFRVSSG